MKRQVKITRGIEPLFGTRDENIRLLETTLQVSTQLLDDSLEIEGEPDRVRRAEAILEDYVYLVQQGQAFTNGDMKNYLRVALDDPQVSLRSVVSSARQRNFGKKSLAPRSANQMRYVEAIERHDMVFAIGPAGTGKTYMAVAMAVSALLAKRVGRIILARPAVEAGERLGFLPGTLQEKIDPYLRPLYDALFDMLDADKVDRYLEKGIIEVAPLAFMRGRSLNESFIILDEAQNCTPEQMKMFVTRLGFGSKAVITGDITQIDLPAGKRSGLLQAIEVVSGVEGVSFIYLDERDVVRHVLVNRIIKAYEQYDSQNSQFSLALDPPLPASSARAGGNGATEAPATPERSQGEPLG